ncbi:MAG TPA: 6-phosphofructokinase, partial [Archangium sp.]|nr:6-phosphofructokinase [Archangium sp.]
IARSFMLRLKRQDFDKPEELARFAAAARLTPEAFRAQFHHLVQGEPEVAVDVEMGLAAKAVEPTGGPAR